MNDGVELLFLDSGLEFVLMMEFLQAEWWLFWVWGGQGKVVKFGCPKLGWTRK
jgi:hypothetical protein